ncbi:MAG TPA: PLP-dependent transferase, partial [Desulfosarcina sp.]|nr:PLP-dependent transferase [Desulfosarcina sp.]
MAAIACTLLQLCRRGDHIVASRTVYGGTHALLTELLPQWGIAVTLVDPTRTEAFEAASRPETRAWYTETVGNPTLVVADIPTLARSARSREITFVVDNTFTPMMVSPAVLGADIVIYSLTKFVNGASDLVAGAICARRAFIRQLMDLHTGRAMLLGPTLDPRAAFDVIQRIPHLAIRMREHSRRAMAMAEQLAAWGVAVSYPGLSSFPQHALLRRLVNEGYGFGGMLTIDCGTQRKAETLMDILQNRERFGFMAVSLGYFDSLMSCSGASTSSEIDEAEQRAMGLSPGLLRLSVGITGNLEERIKQLGRALQECGLAAAG